MQGPSRHARRSVVLALPALALSLASGDVRAKPRRTAALFVLTRSKNANEVHYDVGLDGNGRVDPDDPLVCYWIMRAEDGRREPLTWLERKMAYGFSVIDDVDTSGFRLRLAAFTRREIAVRRAGGRYRPFTAIQGKQAELRRIHVQTDESGALPSVIHVDVFGVLPDGTPRLERLQP